VTVIPDQTIAGEIEEAASSLLSARSKPEALAKAMGWSAEEARGFVTELTDLSWNALLVSEELGGLDAGPYEVNALFRAIGGHLAAAPVRDLVITGPLLANAGSATPAWRDAIISGERLAVTASQRPEHELTVEADQVSGVLPLVSFADVADDLIVCTGADETASVILVEREQQAVQLRARGSVDVCERPFTVELQGARFVRVLSGPEAGAWHRRSDYLGRLAVASETSGIMHTLIDMAVEYAKQRVQFDRPIGSFQALQHILADAWVDWYSLDSLCELTAGAPEEEALELAVAAKAHAAVVGQRVAEQALQVHGAIGYTEELPLHLFYKRALTLASVLGEAADLQVAIANAALGSAA
jgi:alkylation response protein AidB-like acyl-CoA dehydrogenase